MKERSMNLIKAANRAIIGSVLSLVFKVETSENTDLTYHLILVSFFMYDHFPQLPGSVVIC
jgi:hypothetical protein